MTNYRIDDADGTTLTEGLTGYDCARASAQRTADSLGVAVYLSEDTPESETEEIEPAAVHITIRPDADLVGSFMTDDDTETALHRGRMLPASAARLLEVYEAEVVRLCQERWPTAEVTVTGENLQTSGATRSYSIIGESVTERDDDDLREITEQAWQTALKSTDDDHSTATYTIELDTGDAQHIDAVRVAVADLPARDPDFSGVEIEVERGDHTSVDGPDELTGARLLAIVRGVCDPTE